ncbi:hypothetical protein GCM10010182_18880 [Actinomadura cremea]|nr:hypothetical protein GCM10010182_18880 [Actinomadura cremea]
MKYRRKLTILAVPVAASLPLGAGASAAPGDSSASARVCSPGTGYISNQGDVGLGVIFEWRGYGDHYAEGPYDRVLPVGQRTDCAAGFGWPFANGYYVGDGFCAELRTTDSSGRWRYYDDVLNGQAPRPDLGRDFERWEVNAYRC